MDAGRAPPPAMAPGGAVPSFPPGIFRDPCTWGRRAPGEPWIGPDDVADVIRACRQGLGGVEAWALAGGPGAPHFWLGMAFDATTRWRVVHVADGDFLVEAFWVAAIPNERLGDQLRKNVHAANRRSDWVWGPVDAEAWRAAERDRPDAPPAPFAWPNEACVGGLAEGDGGLPLGLLERAAGASWRILAASRWKAYVSGKWAVSIYGPTGDEMLRRVRLRAAITALAEEELTWIRQPGDGLHYGNLECSGCGWDGKCPKCLFCWHKGVPNHIFFQEPKMLTSTKRDWEDDVDTYENLGILPWGAGRN